MAAEVKKIPYKTYCKFCSNLNIKRVAVFMTKYAPAGSTGRDHSKHFACESHVNLIEDTDPNRTRGKQLKELKKSLKNFNDDNLTEADYQTWLKL